MTDLDWERVASDAKVQTSRADELIELADETVARAHQTRAQLEQVIEDHETHL